MTLHWILEPLAMYAALAASSAAALYLFITAKADLRRQEVRHEGQVRDLRLSLDALQARLAGLEADAEFEARSRADVSAPALRGVNVQKRSEALRMCRRGASPEVIMSRLGISQAEAALLMKVHSVLADEPPAPQLAGSFQERSSSREYSFDA